MTDFEKVIQHWEEIVVLLGQAVAVRPAYTIRLHKLQYAIKPGLWQDFKLGSKHCALCSKYMTLFSCTDCPICENTGFDLCENTPYTSLVMSVKAGDLSSSRQAAREELEFLKKLSENGK